MSRRLWAPPPQAIVSWLGAAMLCAVSGMALASGDAQPMRFHSLSIDNGLSQNAVLAITQDSVGFMWLATEDGLNRYDGYQFVHYYNERGNAASLGADFVFDFVEDRNGDLWIATDGGGLSRWDRDTNSFTTYRAGDAPDTLSSNLVRTLTIDGAGRIWVGTRSGGLNRLDPATGVFTRFRHDAEDPHSLSGDDVFALQLDGAGRLWVGTNSGLSRIELDSGRIVRFQHDAGDPRSLADDHVLALAKDGEGTLWVGTKSGGLSRFDGETKGFTTFRADPENPNSLSEDRVNAIFEDSAGRLWIGTAGGLDLYDAERGQFVHYRRDDADQSSLSDDFVMSLYEDRSGLLWVGTKVGGVHKWNPRTWALGHRTADPEDPNGLANSNVTSFATSTDDATLWIGTFGGGLHALDRDSGEMTRFVEDPAGLPDNRVMSLLLDSDGGLWIGTMTGGLARMDSATGTFQRFAHDPQDRTSLAANGIMSLLEDSKGRLWIGTFGGGLNRYDADTGRFVRYPHSVNDATGLASARATALAEDDGGNLWIGTDGGGLTLLNVASGRFHHFRNDPQDPRSLASDVVYSLHVDNHGTVWAGTRGGLDRVVGSAARPAAIRFSNLSKAQGLPNNVVYGVQQDQLGDLWLSTNRGLSRYSPASGELQTFNVDHGIQSNEFHFGAHHTSADGELFFGGPKGYNAFFPKRLPFNELAPAIVLTGFDTFNRPVRSDVPYDHLNEVELGHRDDIVGFEVAALDFAQPKANRYAYKLEGFNDEWIDLGNRRRMTFTNLNHGRYTLRVRAANSDGVWNEAGLALPLKVLPAPWETWWAYLAYAILALASAAGFWMAHRFKLRREEQYARRLERAVSRRTNDLAERNSELETLNERLTETSMTDPLTGLRNRRFLFEQVCRDSDLVDREYAARSSGNHSPDMVFMMVDLDHFKPINDTLGHQADEVLLQVRDVLLDACRSSDFVVRWGGDEFLVVARDISPSEAEALAERIRADIAERVFELEDGQVARTTCSIGFAGYPFIQSRPGATSWEQVLGLADTAMYEAKHTRNAWVGFMGPSRTAASSSVNCDDVHPSSFLFQSAGKGRDALRKALSDRRTVNVLKQAAGS